jgi:coenzyme F420-0:L-glutamate ligase / coenzyme F420-1:gamma-L-glutamate ligase
MSDGLEVRAVRGMPEIHPGDDLAKFLLEAISGSGLALQNGDVLVVAQKVVSKAEGRLVPLDSVTPSQFAIEYARRYEKDARHVEVVLNESRRIVRMDRGVLIVETHHGLICANAGVDASNVEGSDVLCLLPVDSDRSAAELAAAIKQKTGSRVAVIVSDTFGRPWREGQTNVAIGVAGIDPLRNYAGQMDQYGYELRVTQLCVADELAGAAELVMGKIDRVPVAIVRGFEYEPAAGSAQLLVRAAERDLFR